MKYLIGVIITIILGGGIGGYLYVKTKHIQPETVCTQEAKKCPDGSYVLRTLPTCEFQECPVVPSDCAKQGEPPTVFDMTTGKTNPAGKPCCPGLKAIGNKTDPAVIAEGIEMRTSGSNGLCYPCGNGVCEPAFEDVRNCREDCE